MVMLSCKCGDTCKVCTSFVGRMLPWAAVLAQAAWREVDQLDQGPSDVQGNVAHLLGLLMRQLNAGSVPAPGLCLCTHAGVALVACIHAALDMTHPQAPP